MTPEEAFEKWWDKGGGGVCGKEASLSAFLSGLQYQEMNQINCLYEIRKAVGDPEGRLMQDDLIQRVKELATSWRPIKTAPKDWSNIILFLPKEGGEVIQGYYDDYQKWWRCMASNYTKHNQQCHPSKWMPLPSAPQSVTTEKEEAF